MKRATISGSFLDLALVNWTTADSKKVDKAYERICGKKGFKKTNKSFRKSK